jgi:hypothetical protein
VEDSTSVPSSSPLKSESGLLVWLRLGSNVDLRVGESRLHRGSFVSGDEGIWLGKS